MLQLVIVRHGESVRNHASDLAHHGDKTLLEYQLRFERDESGWDLTQHGVDQAKQAGAWIREHIAAEFDRRYVSPFKRTLQTAACLEISGPEWVVDERIREREWGDYAAPGLPCYTVEQYLSDLSHCGEVSWKGPFPGAESVADMVPRCRMFLRDLLHTTRSGRVIVVTHGGTMKALQFVIERLPLNHPELLADRHLTNCSVLHYHLNDFNLREETWLGRVRFVSPAVPEQTLSSWQPIACA